MSNPKKRKATEPLQKEKAEDIINELPKVLSGSEKLQEHLKKFRQGAVPREPLPGLTELNLAYSNVSKAELFSAINVSARLLYDGAEMAILKKENVSIAEALLAKWERCVEKDSPAAAEILENRSVEEVREMLDAAFLDMDGCLEMA
jgi:hypothetical protein